MQLPISMKLQPSRDLALLLVAAHAGAILAVGSLEQPAWVMLPLLLLLFISAWSCHRCWYGVRRIVLLSLRDQGALEYVRQNGDVGEATVHRQSTVTPSLTVILLKGDERVEALVLLPDALNRDDYRRLRVWLRWQTTNG